MKSEKIPTESETYYLLSAYYMAMWWTENLCLHGIYILEKLPTNKINKMHFRKNIC